MSDYGLLFYLSEEFTAADVVALDRLVDELAVKHSWSYGPPWFIDETDGMPEPVRTVGGFLRLPRPIEVDRVTDVHLVEQVSSVVDSLSDFSDKSGCEFELELGGVYAGSIVNGKPDRLVTIGLLDVWRRGS